jgi:glycine/D-amino acid oxidase-like deaminating enzyme
MTSETTAEQPILLDVLVLGGGVQGLWLLRDLTEAGYAAALLDPNPIGGAQTLHSQGFIHHGHAYPHLDADAPQTFKRAVAKWTPLLNDAPEVVARDRAYVGFLALTNALFWQRSWMERTLRFASTPQPPGFPENTLERIYYTPQAQIRPGKLARHLATPFESAIGHGKVELVDLSRDDSRVDAVIARVADKRIKIQPSFVVLAAGAANEALVRLPFLLKVDLPPTHTRQSFVLAVRSEGPPLPEIALLVPDLWLFIVAQRMDDGAPIWLVSSGIDEEEMRGPFTDTARTFLQKLRLAFPTIFDGEAFAQLRFGYYLGTKVEARVAGNKDPPPVITAVHPLERSNVILVWPTKLTLAPLASEQVLDALRKHGLTPSGARVGLRLPEPTYGAERWASLELQPWDDFESTLRAAPRFKAAPDEGPRAESAPKPRRQDRGWQILRHVLVPRTAKRVRVFYHCVAAVGQGTFPKPAAVSGGLSGANIVMEALGKLREHEDQYDFHSINVTDPQLTEDAWVAHREDDLILLDSPICRDASFTEVPHNQYAHRVLRDLRRIRGWTMSTGIKVLTEKDAGVNPKESLALVIGEKAHVANAVWDCGLMARLPNPYKRGSSVLLLSGLHAPATHAAASLVADPACAAEFFKRVEKVPEYFAIGFQVKRSYWPEDLRCPEPLDPEKMFEVISSPWRETALFMSHSSKDDAAASWLVNALRERGHEAVSMRRFRAPYSFRDQIHDAIGTAGHLIFLWSENFKNSDECMAELAWGSGLEKDRRIKLMFVAADGTRLPLGHETQLSPKLLRRGSNEDWWIEGGEARMQELEDWLRVR